MPMRRVCGVVLDADARQTIPASASP